MVALEPTGSTLPAGTLSIVIPVFNGEGWIGACVRHLVRAVEVAGVAEAQLVVVDDGSTDGTVEEVLATEWPFAGGMHLHRQTNQGRLAARRAGLELAANDVVLFIDTRVFIDPDALAFVMPRVTLGLDAGLDRAHGREHRSQPDRGLLAGDRARGLASVLEAPSRIDIRTR